MTAVFYFFKSSYNLIWWDDGHCEGGGGYHSIFPNGNKTTKGDENSWGRCMERRNPIFDAQMGYVLRGNDGVVT